MDVCSVMATRKEKKRIKISTVMFVLSGMMHYGPPRDLIMLQYICMYFDVYCGW